MPGLLRARLRQRPGVADHPRRAARRRLDRQRPEGVDQFRAVRDALRPAHPHRRPGTRITTAITAFFVDMDTPGITVRPLRTMHGVDEFCEVYFDDVVVPADRMLGQAGRRLAARDGPAALRTVDLLLAANRLPVLAIRRAHRRGERSRRTGRRGRCRSRRRLSGAAHVALPFARHPVPARPTARGWAPTPPSTRCCWPPPSSGSTTPRTICCPAQSNSTNHRGGPSILYSRAATIYGGTAEIQRNIIARRLLDLGKE